MKRLKWLMVVATFLVLSVTLSMPDARAGSIGFEVDCDGASGTGNVPAGRPYSWHVRFFDPGTSSGTGFVTDEVYNGTIWGPAEFSPQVSWPIQPTTGTTADDSYYWWEINDYSGLSDPSLIASDEGHFECASDPGPGCRLPCWKIR